MTAISLGAAVEQRNDLRLPDVSEWIGRGFNQPAGEVEDATGSKINWHMFSDGGDEIRAMASSDVQMGDAGCSPLTAAASQGLPPGIDPDRLNSSLICGRRFLQALTPRALVPFPWFGADESGQTRAQALSHLDVNIGKNLLTPPRGF